jgi:hypothetical protein
MFFFTGRFEPPVAERTQLRVRLKAAKPVKAGAI